MQQHSADGVGAGMSALSCQSTDCADVIAHTQAESRINRRGGGGGTAPTQRHKTVHRRLQMINKALTQLQRQGVTEGSDTGRPARHTNCTGLPHTHSSAQDRLEDRQVAGSKTREAAAVILRMLELVLPTVGINSGEIEVSQREHASN